MSRKSALSAFAAANGALETAGRMIAGQRRTFTSTAQRNVSHITNFTPTSSKALDDLLATIRTKIVLPSFLSKEQRKRLYSPKYEKQLQSDPIIVEIDGEVLKFRHLSFKRGDVPNTLKCAAEAIEKFETDADFANLRPLLEGIYKTKHKLGPNFYAKVTRIVSRKGRVTEIIDCAKGVKRTGFTLDSSERVNLILHFVQMKAVNAAWGKDETQQALRMTEVVLAMLEDEAHQPRMPPVDSLPLSRDPQVLMAPLHMAAVLVAEHEADEKGVEKLNKYARDIVRLWPEGKKLTELQPPKMYEDVHQLGYLNLPNKFVALVSPLLYGLEVAQKTVTDPELAQQLASRRDTLRAELEQTRQKLQESGRSGAWGDTVYAQTNAA